MAEALQWHLLDSGAIYRVLALAALHHHVDVTSEDALVPLASHLGCAFYLNRRQPEVILEGEDVSGEIPPNAASQVAAFPACVKRYYVVNAHFAKPLCLIADGRDMGTVVFPDAPVKIFWTPPRKNVRIDVCYSCRRRALVLTLNAFWPRSKNAIIAIVTVL